MFCLTRTPGAFDRSVSPASVAFAGDAERSCSYEVEGDDMRFMNRWDIEEAADRYRDHPVLGPATRTLTNLRDAADANSDGWCYWPKPAWSAAKLMELVDGEDGGRWMGNERERPDATPAKLRAAYAPVKAFRTRSKIAFEIVDVA